MSASKIILGTVQFGLPYGINNISGQPSQREAFQILDKAYEAGIRILDTAEAYGSSIDVISAYHMYSKNRFAIINKFKDVPVVKELEKRITDFIVRCDITMAEAYMFHCFDDYKRSASHVHRMKELQREGLIKHVGVSVYTENEFRDVLENENIDLIQFPLNLLDNYSRKSELIKEAKNLKKTLHVRSIFLQGLFFMDRQKFPPRLKPLIKYLEKLDAIANEASLTLEGLAINYIFSNNNIDKVLIGIETSNQLEKNLGLLQVEIHPNVYKEIDAIRIKCPELLNPANWNI